MKRIYCSEQREEFPLNATGTASQALIRIFRTGNDRDANVERRLRTARTLFTSLYFSHCYNLAQIGEFQIFTTHFENVRRITNIALC